MDESEKEMLKRVEAELRKALMEGKPKNTNNTNIRLGCGDTSTWTHVYASNDASGVYSIGIIAGNTESRLDFIPTKIIYNCPATICFFPDGSKVMVKCAKDEEYVKEYGVMACINKKIFESRNSFKKLVNSGYENQDAIFERIAHNGQLKRQK